MAYIAMAYIVMAYVVKAYTVGYWTSPASLSLPVTNSDINLWPIYFKNYQNAGLYRYGLCSYARVVV